MSGNEPGEGIGGGRADAGEGCSSERLTENGHRESQTSATSAGLEESARVRRAGAGQSGHNELPVHC